MQYGAARRHFLHVVGAKKASIGYSSSLPKSMMTESAIFTGVEKMLNQLAGPICPIPGPIFDMQASAAVKFVVMS